MASHYYQCPYGFIMSIDCHSLCHTINRKLPNDYFKKTKQKIVIEEKNILRTREVPIQTGQSSWPPLDTY